MNPPGRIRSRLTRSADPVLGTPMRAVEAVVPGPDLPAPTLVDLASQRRKVALVTARGADIGVVTADDQMRVRVGTGASRARRRSGARVGWLTALAVAGIVVAGCSSSHAKATPTSTATRSTTATTHPTAKTAPTPTTAPAVTTTTSPPGPSTTSASESSRCHTSELTASLEIEMSAMGSGGAVLTLTNQSSRTCTLYGYVGLQLVDANRRFLPTSVERIGSMLFRDHGPTSISLALGQSAQAGIGYGADPTVGTPHEQPCPSARYLEVTPPDEKDYLFIDAKGIQACENGHLAVTALQLGRPFPD